MKFVNTWWHSKRLGPVQWSTKVQCWRLKIGSLTTGDNGDWKFDDVPVDSHVDVRASLPADFIAICEQCRADNLEVPANANAVFGFVPKNLGAVLIWTWQTR